MLMMIKTFLNLSETSSIMKKMAVKAWFDGEYVLTEDTDEARLLFDQSRYGSLTEDNRLRLSLMEALYLMDKNKITILTAANRKLKKQTFLRRAKKLEPHIMTRYAVFKDLRNRGYIVKTALKFGADFRVYDRGIKPGEDHARWVVYPVAEASALTWHEFAAKNRVAHSTKKRLMIGVVDEEDDVSYWEVRWLRP